MKNSARLQLGEKYECTQEHGPITFDEATDKWECPYCFNKLAIRAQVGEYLHTIHRVFPQELSKWDIVTTDFRHTREVKNVEPDRMKDGYFRIALKEFGVHTAKTDDFIAKIMGAWED